MVAACQPGELHKDMLPTFIIAGVPKAGTTSLWRHLKCHPQVGMSFLKEPFFFTESVGMGKRMVGKEARFSGRYALGLPWYESLFRACQGASAVGEASGIYFSEADAPALIQKHIPGIRLLFILRDPVERLYSHYWQDLKLGFPLPDFRTLVLGPHSSLERYLYLSSYQLHLERFLSYFPRQQMAVFLYDDLRDNPRQMLSEAYRFIGVEPGFEPPGLGKIYNQRMVYRSVKVYYLTRRFTFRLFTARGQAPPAWWSAIVDVIDRRNERLLPNLPLPPELRARLLPQVEAATEYVEGWLNRKLPAWRQV